MSFVEDFKKWLKDRRKRDVEASKSSAPDYRPSRQKPIKSTPQTQQTYREPSQKSSSSNTGSRTYGGSSGSSLGGSSSSSRSSQTRYVYERDDDVRYRDGLINGAVATAGMMMLMDQLNKDAQKEQADEILTHYNQENSAQNESIQESFGSSQYSESNYGSDSSDSNSGGSSADRDYSSDDNISCDDSGYDYDSDGGMDFGGDD